MVRVKRKRCTRSGCRKLQAPGVALCTDHMSSAQASAAQAPIESVVRMTDIERLNLVKIETECVNILLQLRNHDLETEEVKRKFTADLNSRSAHREQLLTIAETRKTEQQRTVRDIAEKYGLDPQQMAYDPDTGVLRDIRQET
jgi:hypothetical protein